MYLIEKKSSGHLVWKKINSHAKEILYGLVSYLVIKFLNKVLSDLILILHFTFTC